MTNSTTLPWAEPLEFAAQYAGYDCMALLYAAQPAPDGSWRSILALNPIQTITESWEALEAALNQHPDDYWLGYIGYEMGNDVLRGQPTSTIALPPLWMTRFATLFFFDHHQQQVVRWGKEIKPLPLANTEKTRVTQISSNMTRAEYLQKVEQTLTQIQQGEFYQANITRKFYGELETSPAPFLVYRQLAESSNAAYSAYLRIGDKTILSSSPESFLQIDNHGKVSARPIKGTARRSGNASQDKIIYQELANSTKNRAENLMIVDLMRHDLSQSCVTGSIQVDELFKITQHPHLYHMVSTISGQKKEHISSLDLIQSCFPPGSMTGAPKRSAIHWCQQMENMQRGIYSGALGWLRGKNEAELSVVIRTLLLENNCFEFQVGGGIVVDSTAESEWEETLTKAMGIAHILDIPLQKMQQI